MLHSEVTKYQFHECILRTAGRKAGLARHVTSRLMAFWPRVRRRVEP